MNYIPTALQGGACGVMIVIMGNGPSDQSSNPG